MKLQSVIQILFSLGAVSASAFPVGDLNRMVAESYQGWNCNRKSSVESYRDLIVKASYFEEDDRELLSVNREKVGFSVAEQEQAMRCTGRVWCPGANSGRGSLISAGAICPKGQRSSGGQCAADRLGTIGHLFVDKATNQFIPRMDKCEFRSYRGHTSKLVIEDIKNIINPQDSNYNPRQNTRADKLVIRLKSPIPNCDPYDLDEMSNPPPAGTEVVALTHPQEDQGDKFDGNEPVAFKCEIKRRAAARNGGPSLLYSDCDVNGGGSGGFMLIRNSNGRLAVTALFTGSGLLSDNGKSYNEAERLYTVAVGTNADFQQLALNPGKRPEPGLATGDSPSSTIRPVNSGN